MHMYTGTCTCYAQRFNSYVEVMLVALKSKLEVKMSATKLPRCVTVKT